MKSSRLKPSQHKCVLRGRVGLLLFPLLDKEFVGHSNSESAYYAFEIDGVIARGQRWEHQPVAVGDIGRVRALGDGCACGVLRNVVIGPSDSQCGGLHSLLIQILQRLTIGNYPPPFSARLSGRGS